MSMSVVEVRGLVKKYGKVLAVNNLSFRVEEGEVFGIIGPNGAGKTTTLRILATLVKPTAGIVRVLGFDIEEEAGEVRRAISYLPEEAGLYSNLKGVEYLRFMASLTMSEKVEEAVSIAAKLSGLGGRLNDKTSTYSKGMKRRLLVSEL